MRLRWLFLLLLVTAFVALVFTQRAEIRALMATLAHGRWPWLLAALALEAGYFVLFAVTYHYSFAAVGVQRRVRTLLPLLLASIFVSTVAPTGSVGGAAVVVDETARRGAAPARGAEGVLLVWAAQTAALLPIVAMALGYLYHSGDLRAYQILGALAYLLYVCALTGALFLGCWQAAHLRLFLSWAARAANRLAALFRRGPWLAAGWSARTTRDLCAAGQAISSHPRALGATLMVAFASHLLSLGCLYALFLAFSQPVHVGVLASGFALGVVFSTISVIPLDVGVVEAAMTLIYSSLGVPVSRAVVIVLAFRGITTWLPILAGFVLVRSLSIFRDR